MAVLRNGMLVPMLHEHRLGSRMALQNPNELSSAISPMTDNPSLVHDYLFTPMNKYTTIRR